MTRPTAKPATAKFGSHPTHKKVFDVVRPNKAMPSTNARSTIVTDKPQTDDDQFVPTVRRATIAVPEAKKTVSKHKKPELTPVTAKADDFPPPSAPAVPSSRSSKREPRDPPPAPAAILEEAPADHDELLDFDLSEPAPGDPKPSAPAVTATPQPSAHEPPRPAEPEPEVTPPAAAMTDETDPLLAEPDPNTTDESAYTDFLTGPDEPGKSEKVEVDRQSPANGGVEPPSTDTEPDPTQPIVPDALPREDLLAGAGMTMPVHEEDPRPIISHHKRGLRWWQVVLVILLILLLGLTAFNFVLDAELITPKVDLPHTNLL